VHDHDLNVNAAILISQQTPADFARMLSGNIALVAEPGFGKCISGKRMRFRRASRAGLLSVAGGRPARMVCGYASDRRTVPLTITISPSRAVMMVALFALACRGQPQGDDSRRDGGVELCCAKSVEACSAARWAWTIEGCIDTGEVV
jgi:hypothetical protein